jgi:hypothetical protein
MRVSVDQMQRSVARELSLSARLFHAGLLLVSAGMSATVGGLLLTEPALPARTRIAFGVMTAIGASWAIFAGWVLSRRRVMLAKQRVIAGWMAVVFTSVFVAGAWLLRGELGRSATGASTVMWAVAVVWLATARRRYASLLARRRALEQPGGVQ